MELEDKFINLLLKKLPEDKVTELQILMEVGNKEKIHAFIASILPDIDKIISDNLDKLRISSPNRSQLFD